MVDKTVGLIGCGLIADTHVEAIKEVLPDYKITVCDSQPGKANLLVKKYSLKNSYISIAEMLSVERPFCVHVLSPPQYHVEHVAQCLKAGCHVIVEKPIAFKVGDAIKLYDIAREYNRILCVDHSLLFQPSVKHMIEKMDSDVLDQVLYVNCFYGLDIADGTVSVFAPEGHWKRKLPGGAIIDSIIHPVTLAVELTGRPIELKVNFTGSFDNPREVQIFWRGETAMASITVSSQAQPFRRQTEVTTKKQTFIVDHSTETLISLGSGFGPKALRKLIKNFGHGSQLIIGTIGTIANVMTGKLKQNPGARGLIEAFYKHLISEGKLPVSELNVRNSVYALEKIIEALTPSTRQIESLGVQKITNNINNKDHCDSYTKTLVTGASGFLGGIISENLAKKGRRVIAQVRRGPNADKLQSPNINRIYDDFNYESVNYDLLVEGAKEIIHCAHASSAKTWEQFKKVNIDATTALYDAAVKAGCEKFIFLSSVAVYGVHQKGYISVDEETPSICGRSRWDFYIRSKTIAENLLREKAMNGGPKLIIIRPGILYSNEGMRLTRKSIPLKDSRLFIIFGKGKNRIPFTRVDILAKVICDVLEMDPFPVGIYNICGNPEEGSRNFIQNRMKKLGINCRFVSLPAFPFRITAGILEFLYLITFRKRPPLITRYIIDSSTRDMYYDCLKAERILGWNPREAIQI
jgi:predicted dehydrogenase/nucleoside-diphosphate-sugar epimerase